MNKKALSLAVLLSLATTCAFAADTNKVDSKLAKYQQEAVLMTQETIAAKANEDVAIPSTVSLNENRTVELALENNRSIKQSNWAYEAAKANVSAAAAAKNPSVGYGYNGGKTQGNDNSASNTFSLKVPIFDAATDASLDSARYKREGAQAATIEAQQSAKLAAITDYYDLVKARNKIEVAEQAVRDYDGHLTNVNAQYGVGIVAKSDVLASKTNKANADTQLVQAKNNANIAESTLNTILALPTSTKIETADKEMGYRPYNVTLEQAKAYAQLHRATLVEAMMNVKSAESAIKSAKAGHLPSFNFNANERYNSLDDLWGKDDHNWTIGASLDWSLWDGGATNEKIKAAKAQYEQVKEANLETIDKTLLEVQEAYLNMRSAEETINSTKAAVESGQENFRIASLRYRAGVGTNVDVLDAEKDLFESRNNYVDALYDYNVSVAQLEKAVGVPVETPVAGGAPIIAQSDSINQLNAIQQRVANQEENKK